MRDSSKIVRVEIFYEDVVLTDIDKLTAEANDYAYERSGVLAVPSYRMDGRKLDSIEDIGITKNQLADFLRDSK